MNIFKNIKQGRVLSIIISVFVVSLAIFLLPAFSTQQNSSQTTHITNQKTNLFVTATPKTAHAEYGGCQITGCGQFWNPGAGGGFDFGGWASDILNTIDNFIGSDLSQYGDALDLITGILEEMGVDFGVAEDIASWVDAAEGITNTVQNISDFEDFSEWAGESGNIEDLAGSVTTLLGLGEEYENYDEAVSVISNQISSAAEGYSDECADGDEGCNVAKFIGDEIKKQIESASDQIDELDQEFDDMEDIKVFLQDTKRYVEMVKEFREYQEQSGGGSQGSQTQWCYDTNSADNNDNGNDGSGGQCKLKPYAWCATENDTTVCYYAEEDTDFGIGASYDDPENACKSNEDATCVECQRDTECGDGTEVEICEDSSGNNSDSQQCFSDKSTCQENKEQDESSVGSCEEVVVSGGNGALSNARFSPQGELLVKETRQREKDRCLDALAQETSKKVLGDLSKSVLTWVQSGFEAFGESGQEGFIKDLEIFQTNTSNQIFNEFIRDQKNFEGICSFYREEVITRIKEEYEQQVGSEESGVPIEDVMPSFSTSCPLEDSLSSSEAEEFLEEGNFTNGGWEAWGKVLEGGLPVTDLESTRTEVQSDLQEAIDNAKLEYETGEGFRSVTNDSGEVVTPGIVVSRIFNRVVNSDTNRAELVDEMNEVVNDFGDLFISQVVSDNVAGIDPDDREEEPPATTTSSFDTSLTDSNSDNLTDTSINQPNNTNNDTDVSDRVVTLTETFRDAYEFTIELTYTQNNAWNYTVDGSVPNDCLDVAVQFEPSSQQTTRQGIDITAVVQRTQADEFCNDVVSEITKSGSVPADPNAQFTFSVLDINNEGAR